MNKIICLLLLLLLTACGNRRLKAYEDVINRTDRMVVAKVDLTDSFVLDSPARLEHVKDIFKRNIKPIDASRIIPDQFILLYAKGVQIGKLVVSNAEKPVVGFYTDSLMFSFKMTYGIGMFLFELSAGKVENSVIN